MTTIRRLAAILAADIAGYSRMMAADEVGTLNALKACRREVVDPAIAKHNGRIVKTTGDGMLVEFGSAVDAVTCAMAVQQAMAGQVAQSKIAFRIGINVGDIIIDGDDIFGDGVNIAARMENECEPGSVYLSDDAFRQVRAKTAFAFDDLGEKSLKNIDRPIRIYAVHSRSAASAFPDASKPLPLPDKPSIAVLPFQNMSGDPEQEYFADGMVEDIITALSRFKSLFVIARNSSFTYKGKAVDIKQVGRELGVRYVLEGSVRKAGGRVRITGQLIDSETGAHLWADRFEGSLEDVFELQDEVTTNVVGSIAPKVEQAEIERAKRKPLENLSAYDYFLRGLANTRVVTRDSYEEALRLFYRSIELDPGFSTPYGLIARCYNARSLQGWVVDRDHEEAETRRITSLVSAIGLDDAVALCWSGLALFRICREDTAAAAQVDRALSINQNFADGWHVRGIVSLGLGQHEAAIGQSMRSIRLDPLDPEIYRPEAIIAQAHFLLGRYDEAMNLASVCVGRQPNWVPALRVMVAANALAGNITEARASVADLLSYHPQASILGFQRDTPYRRPEDRARMAQGLRIAGLPE